MTFLDVVLASILGQLILGTILTIIHNITVRARDKQRKKTMEAAKNLMDSVAEFNKALESFKNACTKDNEVKEDKKDE